jgi:hypothetical protein
MPALALESDPFILKGQGPNLASGFTKGAEDPLHVKIYKIHEQSKDLAILVSSRSCVVAALHLLARLCPVP